MPDDDAQKPPVLEATITMVGTIDGKSLLGLINAEYKGTVRFDGFYNSDWLGKQARVEYGPRVVNDRRGWSSTPSTEVRCSVTVPSGSTYDVDPAFYDMRKRNDSKE